MLLVFMYVFATAGIYRGLSTCAVYRTPGLIAAAFCARLFVHDDAAFRYGADRLVNRYGLVQLVMIHYLGMGFDAYRRAAILRPDVAAVAVTRFATGIAISDDTFAFPDHAAIIGPGVRGRGKSRD